MRERFAGNWDHTADVVIVGFGGAGGCAAIEAHDAGTGVVILEKQPKSRHYSNTRMSGGGFHSPDPAGDREALKEYAKAMFSGENLPWKFEGDQTEYSDGLADIWADRAPQNESFMRGLDPNYKTTYSGDAAFPDFPGAAGSKYRLCLSGYDCEISADSDLPDGPKEKPEEGEAFHACVLRGLTDRAIRIDYDTRVMKLIEDDNGAVTGVKAEQRGRSLYYRAKKAVILASGGYEYNKALRLAFLDGAGADGWAFYGSPANTGDGIVMALETGAALLKAGSAAARLIASFPDFRTNGVRIGVPIPSVGRGNAFITDNYGRRFCNEREISKDPTRYITYKHALAFDVSSCRYPRIPSWFIFDENLKTRKSITNNNIARYFGYPWSDDNHEAVERGWILKGDTLSELCRNIKTHPDNKHQMDEKTFFESVNRFNELCALGEDEDFMRDSSSMQPVERPPFYALPLFPGGPNTKGGLRANEKRQVVDWDGNAIPRLYAAGEIASVFKFVYQAGGNLAECIVCGRTAGANAASEPASD